MAWRHRLAAVPSYWRSGTLPVPERPPEWPSRGVLLFVCPLERKRICAERSMQTRPRDSSTPLAERATAWGTLTPARAGRRVATRGLVVHCLAGASEDGALAGCVSGVAVPSFALSK